jgi:hypothetical protein
MMPFAALMVSGDSSRGKSRLQEKTAVQEGHRHSDHTGEEFSNIVTVAFAYLA